MESINAEVEIPSIKRGRGRPSSRKTILDAAQQIALKRGAEGLSLDAVAKLAGVSRGGLRYNFRSKDSLLLALTERLIEENQLGHREEMLRLPSGRGRELLAYVINSTRTLDSYDLLAGTLMGNLIQSASLRVPVIRHFSKRFKLLSRDISFEGAAIIHLATEGLWFLELFKISPFSAVERVRILAKLQELVEAEILNSTEKTVRNNSAN